MAQEGENGLGLHWDKWNRPIGYIIGTSPGFAQFGQGEERLINMGLGRKIVKASRLGFDFAMIDYETLSEMYEKDVEKLIEHVKAVQKIEVGLHLPVKLDLCIANSFEWKEMHEILRKGAFSAKRIVGAKFILFHTSSRIRPHVTFTVGHQEPSVQQNSFNGQNLGEWIDNVDKGKFKDPKTGKVITAPKNVREWFKSRFTRVLFHVMGLAGDVGVLTFLEGFENFKEGVNEASNRMINIRQRIWDEKAKAEILSYLRNEEVRAVEPDRKAQLRALIDYVSTTPLERDILDPQISRMKDRIIEKWINGGVHPEERLGETTELYKEYQTYGSVESYVIRTDFDKVFDFWVRKGSECEEQVSYRVVAKFMYWTKDPLWMDIVGDYDPDIIIKCADVNFPYYDKQVFEKSGIITGKPLEKEKEESKEKKEKDMTKRLVEALITAVACKYIQGHLYVEGGLLGMKGEFPNDKELKDESAYKFCRAANIQIYIETAMPPEGQEGELRIMSAHDHVTLAKQLDGGEFTSYTMDFEHLTVNFVKVDDDIASLKDGDGKYIRMMHINAPRPVIGAHAPLDILSHDMFIIYSWLFKLRNKGMRDSYLIWEMGSFGINRSAIAFRNLVAELVKDTDPLKLPAHFYGIDDTIFAAQHNAIREHGLDPLKGLIMVPEVDHGVFSKAAVEKGKAKEWEEEKYKY